MPTTHRWYFPLQRTHTGMLQGNGVMGVMIWGDGGELRITIGRADLWDHRGGMPWTEKMSFANIRARLEADDEPGLRALFEQTANGEGEPARPSVIPIGRVDIDFGAGSELTAGDLDFQTGKAVIHLTQAGREHTVALALAMDQPLLVGEISKGLRIEAIRSTPAWEYVGEHLASISFEPPTMLDDKMLDDKAIDETSSLAGWVQRLPVDPPICIGRRQSGRTFYIAAARSEQVADDAGAIAAATSLIAHAEAAKPAGFAGIQQRNESWWHTYWQDAATVELPNERLQFMHDYGMYKYAGLTHPKGVAATLQGPWIEEYQMPPWSSDYHFNINVQLCYQPGFHGNKLDHLKPLWELIAGWSDVLHHNAKVFLDIDDGVMLPHAVDDQCMCMGGFWTGSIDHGCTAWVALMMYRYHRYAMDDVFLRDTAYPFMVASMRVYQGMIEEHDGRLSLPVSVSPEYRGANMNAWGRDASFQLACCHALAEALQSAADALGEPRDPAWADLLERLPKACLLGKEGQQEIALWEGTPLEESHRHHSHLSGITPFDIFDYDDPKWQAIVAKSLRTWVFRGPGLWSGWCVPWASMIHSHIDDADAAAFMVELTKQFFTNEGHGTLHDVSAPGMTLMGAPGFSLGHATGETNRGRREIMQMDAGMAATAAVQEMMIHTRRGVNHVFAGCPSEWRSVRFKGMRTDGGFLVSGTRGPRCVEEIRIESPFGGVMKLRNPWTDDVSLRVNDAQGQSLSGDVLEIPSQPGDVIVLTASA